MSARFSSCRLRRGGHHRHSLALRSGVARNDLQCNARMIIIVLRMIAESLGGLRTHVHVLARAVLHEGFQQRACQVSGHALNGEAGRGDYLARESFALMNHIQSMSDCTSRSTGRSPSAKAITSARFIPKPSPIQIQCSEWAFSTRLKRALCDEYQGLLFSAAIPAETFSKKLPRAAQSEAEETPLTFCAVAAHPVSA